MNENLNEEKQEEIEVIETKKETQEELLAKLKENIEKAKAKGKEAQEVMRQGKGILHLETPILAGDEKITELVYDFTDLTGMEYVDAMDDDMNAQQIYRITYRQALALFAKAAAKQTENVDMRDIIERIGITDAVEGVQLATLFFSASTRSGRLRISKK